MRKFIAIVVVALVVLCGASFYIYKTNDVNETYENKEIKNDSNMLSMMLETSAGSGEYQQTTASAWPTEGYVFNENLSKCEQGSSLSWDSSKNTVVMIGNVSDRCYVYFNVYIPPAINEVCSNGDTMSDCIKKLYTKQGENNLYLHNSTLENGAGDNSYRYSGSSDTTNNFVCFGYDSTEGTCPNDNLYRIIGVFDNQVKLIKYDYANSNLLGTDGDYADSSTPNSSYYKGNLTSIDRYYWNYKNDTSINDGYGSNTWSTSLLNNVNLNSFYLNNIGTNWSNKIAMHTWKVGGNFSENISEVTVSNTYKNEITSPFGGNTYNAKIGLMYVSDYGYSAAPSAWATSLYNGSGNDYRLSSVKSVNWMYMGFTEITISPEPYVDFDVFCVFHSGYVTTVTFISEGQEGLRPVFYLNSNIAYVSGSGTISSPILIK